MTICRVMKCTHHVMSIITDSTMNTFRINIIEKKLLHTVKISLFWKMILEGPFRLMGDERYSAGSFDVSENFIFSFDFKMSVLPENKTFNVLRRVSSPCTGSFLWIPSPMAYNLSWESYFETQLKHWYMVSFVRKKSTRTREWGWNGSGYSAKPLLYSISSRSNPARHQRKIHIIQKQCVAKGNLFKLHYSKC